MPIIEIEDLSKKFGENIALNRVSFSVSRGESFALLGPNGAGKTTLVRIVGTLIKPTSGSVRVEGYDIVEEPEEVKKLIGVVSHNPFLYDDLTARENLRFFADLYEAGEDRIDSLLRKVNLHERGEDLVGTYSRGMKQRLSIARALLHNPKVLILDEPTVGLDLQGKRTFYGMIGELNSKGRTILLTTHHLGEAEELCKKTCILDRGEVMACGSLDEIKGMATLEETFLRLTRRE